MAGFAHSRVVATTTTNSYAHATTACFAIAAIRITAAARHDDDDVGFARAIRATSTSGAIGRALAALSVGRKGGSAGVLGGAAKTGGAVGVGVAHATE